MKLFVLFCVLLIVGPLLGADQIPPAEAKDHIGQNGTVCGRVADTRYLATGSRPTFLNFDKRYPNHTFTAVIFGENRAKFGTAEKDYRDKDVCVTGKIREYRGKPEIILTDPAQLKVK